jgi:hypothetical protein
LIHRFVKNGNYCHECHQTMEVKLENLPADFTAHFLTKTKSRGKLRYSSPKKYVWIVETGGILCVRLLRCWRYHSFRLFSWYSLYSLRR